MTVRIDRTNLQRGRGSNIAIFADTDITADKVYLSVFDVVNDTVVEPEFVIDNSTNVKKVNFTTPKVDGFLFANVNGVKLIKKVGTPPFTFCITHKKGFAVPYEMFNEHGTKVKSGNLREVVDGFYAVKLMSEVSYIKVSGKVFTLKEEFDSLSYEVDINNAELSQIDLPQLELTATIPDIALSDIEHENIALQDPNINATIREV